MIIIVKKLGILVHLGHIFNLKFWDTLSFYNTKKYYLLFFLIDFNIEKNVHNVCELLGNCKYFQ